MSVFKNSSRSVFFLFLLMWSSLYSDNSQVLGNANTSVEIIGKQDRFDKPTNTCKKHKELTYYLFIKDFIKSFIQIPTSNVSERGSTISSKYLAGRAPLYNIHDKRAGTCSATFLCMQTQQGIFVDIANYISVDNGLIITWFTPTTLANLKLDSIVHSMVTECLVRATTKVGFNPFYGEEFNMIVSADDEKIFFKLTKL